MVSVRGAAIQGHRRGDQGSAAAGLIQASLQQLQLLFRAGCSQPAVPVPRAVLAAAARVHGTVKLHLASSR